MKLTGPGKVVLFLLVIGFGIGAWRMIGKGAGGFKLPSLPGKANGNSGNSNGNSKSNSGDNSGSNASTNSGNGGTQLLLLTSPSKGGWLQDEITKFNAKNAGRYEVTITTEESREAMHAIISGAKQPILYAPSSSAFASRVDEVWQSKKGKRLINMDDGNAFRVYFRSPIVFVTTKNKAAFLKPLLGGANPWGAMRALCSGQTKAPWGKFRFSTADPLKANSGFLTLGSMLYAYGQQTGMNQSFEKLAVSSGFQSFLRDIKKGLVFDADARNGSSALFKAFVRDPGRYDVITSYENLALGAATSNPNLVVIYPRPAMVSDYSVAVLSGSWVTPEQKQGGQEFIQFLGSDESLGDGVNYNFRPARPSSKLSLNSQLSAQNAQGFQTDFAAAELPPYSAVNNANSQWLAIIGG